MNQEAPEKITVARWIGALCVLFVFLWVTIAALAQIGGQGWPNP
jgi:hypothetical protein